MKNKQHPVSLDELALSKLPARVVKAIGDLEVSLDEWIVHESSKPSFKVAITDGWVEVYLHRRISVRKMIAIAGGTTTALIGLIKYGTEIYNTVTPLLTKIFA